MTTEFNFGFLNNTQFVNQFVGNSDPQDIYSFSVNTPSNFNLALTNLSTDADVRLIQDNNNNGIIDAGDVEVARSELFDNLDESINLSSLETGNYLVDVYQFEGNTNYTLALSTTNPSNLLPTEFNLGNLNGNQTFNGFVDSRNTVDTYQFSLDTTRSFNLFLSGLSADADVRLIQDANNNGLVDFGEEIARSELTSNSDESISDDSLAAGDYLVQVYQFQDNTDYTLGLSTPDSVASSTVDLVGQFGTINLPDTVDFRDDGTASVSVINQSNAVAQGPVSVNLYISTDNNIDRDADGELVNDRLLTTLTQNINLQPGQSTTFNLPYENLTSVVAPGAYHLIAEIDSPSFVESNERNNTASALVSAPGTDVVIDWNATALNAIQAVGEINKQGVLPTEGSRLLAITHAAIYDAVNAFEQQYTPYAVNTSAPLGASVEAAAVGAAYQTLVTLLPEQRALFDTQLTSSLAEISDSLTAEAEGLAFGQLVADQILALRTNDGSEDNTPYSPPQGEYVWRPGADGFAVSPNWGSVTPFALPNIAQFAPDGLDGTFGSDRYAREIEQVRTLGGLEDTAQTIITRDADQTEVAHFWSYDRSDTFRPYGQLNQITEEVAVRESNTLSENARLFAQLNIALADAAIVAWDAKYDVVQARPDDVIAEGLAENDGIPFTVGDPDWQPLLGTPTFPDYISGHTTFAGAFAGVLTNFFGEDYEFTAVSQELTDVTRSYGSFFEAAQEDGLSRVYGGVHVLEATITDALPTGVGIGNFVAQNIAQPLVA